MLNFKLIKNKLKSVKCLIKKAFMVKQSQPLPPANNPKNRYAKFTATKGNPSNCQVPSASSAEGFIPLAARDSQWVGIEFYNPNFRSPFDEEDDVEEVELQNLAADTDAILQLFPGLTRSENLLLKERESSSTTEITRLLVGQKADFRGMKSSKKLLPDKKLDSVQEMQEEKNPSETDISFSRSPISARNSGSEVDHYDDEDEEPKRSTHTKRRKKKSDMKLMEAEASSISVLDIKKRSGKVRSETPKLQQPLELSGQSSFADDERNESSICTESFTDNKKNTRKCK